MVALAAATDASSYARHLRSDPGDIMRERMGNGKGAPRGRLGKGIRPGLMQRELDARRGQAMAARGRAVGNAPLAPKGGQRRQRSGPSPSRRSNASHGSGATVPVDLRRHSVHLRDRRRISPQRHVGEVRDGDSRRRLQGRAEANERRREHEARSDIPIEDYSPVSEHVPPPPRDVTTESAWALAIDLGIPDEVVSAALWALGADETLDNFGLAEIPRTLRRHHHRSDSR